MGTRRLGRCGDAGHELTGRHLLLEIFQIVAQIVGQLVAPRGILLQTAPQDAREVPRQLRPEAGDRRRVVTQDRGKEMSRGLSL